MPEYCVRHSRMSRGMRRGPGLYIVPTGRADVHRLTVKHSVEQRTKVLDEFKYQLIIFEL